MNAENRTNIITSRQHNNRDSEIHFGEDEGDDLSRLGISRAILDTNDMMRLQPQRNNEFNNRDSTCSPSKQDASQSPYESFMNESIGDRLEISALTMPKDKMQIELERAIALAPPFSEIQLPNQTIELRDIFIQKPLLLRGQVNTKIMLSGSIYFDPIVADGQTVSMSKKPVVNGIVSTQPVPSTSPFRIIPGTGDNPRNGRPLWVKDHDTEYWNRAALSIVQATIILQREGKIQGEGEVVCRVPLEDKILTGRDGLKDQELFQGVRTDAIFKITPWSIVYLESCTIKASKDTASDLIASFDGRANPNNTEPSTRIVMSSCYLYGLNGVGCDQLHTMIAENCYFEKMRNTALNLVRSRRIHLKSTGFSKCKASCIQLSDLQTSQKVSIELEECRFIDCQTTCISAVNHSKEFTQVSIKIDKCQFQTNQNRCVEASGAISSLAITSCVFERNYRDCIRVDSIPLGIRVNGCKFIENSSRGVFICASPAVITNNDFKGGVVGVRIESGSHLSLRKITSNLDYNMNNTLTMSGLTPSGSSGVGSHGKLINISLNTMSNMSGAGIVIAKTTGMLVNIKENKVTGCLYGISIGEPEDTSKPQALENLQRPSNTSLEPSQNKGASKSLAMNIPSTVRPKFVKEIKSFPQQASSSQKTRANDSQADQAKVFTFADEEEGSAELKSNIFNKNWLFGVKIGSDTGHILIEGGNISDNGQAAIGMEGDYSDQLEVVQSGSKKASIDGPIKRIPAGAPKEILLKDRVPDAGCQLI